MPVKVRNIIFKQSNIVTPDITNNITTPDAMYVPTTTHVDNSRERSFERKSVKSMIESIESRLR